MSFTASALTYRSTDANCSGISVSAITVALEGLTFSIEWLCSFMVLINGQTSAKKKVLNFLSVKTDVMGLREQSVLLQKDAKRSTQIDS